MKKMISGFLMALLGGVVSLSIYKALEPETLALPSEQSAIENTFVNLSPTEPIANVDYVTAAEMTVNGVVHVKTSGTIEYSRRGFDPFRELFYGNGTYEKQYIQPIKGAGSGVIVSPEGHIVTNNHVIESADQIDITLNNNKTYQAELIGRDPSTDLAVLKIESAGLPYLRFGNSDDLHVGEWVLAVGNPFNLTSTVTAGIVSAKGRDINILKNDPVTGLSSIESFIQTDAAVNPGNSGGALVNTKGELIGINAAIKSNTGSFAGYSFAIPSNIVRKVVNDLIEYGNIQRGFLGVHIRDIDDELAKDNELDNFNGVYVSELMPDGSAKEAGIKEGDIIKKINDFEVKNVSDLQAKVGEYRPGDNLTVSILRNGQLIEKQITLKNLEGSTHLIQGDDKKLLMALGAKLKQPSEEELKELNLDGGVQIVDLFPGKLLKSGIQKGFIITHVDHEEILSQEDLLQTLNKKKGGVLLQGVYPNGREAFYAFGL